MIVEEEWRKAPTGNNRSLCLLRVRNTCFPAEVNVLRLQIRIKPLLFDLPGTLARLPKVLRVCYIKLHSGGTWGGGLEIYMSGVKEVEGVKSLTVPSLTTRPSWPFLQVSDIRKKMGFSGDSWKLSQKWQIKYKAWKIMAWSKRKEYKYSVFFSQKEIREWPECEIWDGTHHSSKAGMWARPSKRCCSVTALKNSHWNLFDYSFLLDNSSIKHDLARA